MECSADVLRYINALGCGRSCWTVFGREPYSLQGLWNPDLV